MKSALIMYAALLAGASVAAGQDKPEDRTHQILERIEKEIQASHAKLLEDIREIVRTELKKDGAKTAPSAEKPYLGITLADLTDEEREPFKLQGGVKVGEVRGPAEKAGIEVGDIIYEIDGKWVADEKGLSDLIGMNNPRDTVTLSVIRAKKAIQIKVVLGVRKN